eukprot:1139657-Pelagomonas_calceolata.AAC.1
MDLSHNGKAGALHSVTVYNPSLSTCMHDGILTGPSHGICRHLLSRPYTCGMASRACCQAQTFCHACRGQNTGAGGSHSCPGGEHGRHGAADGGTAGSLRGQCGRAASAGEH